MKNDTKITFLYLPVAFLSFIQFIVAYDSLCTYPVQCSSGDLLNIPPAHGNTYAYGGNQETTYRSREHSSSASAGWNVHWPVSSYLIIFSVLPCSDIPSSFYDKRSVTESSPR